MIWRGRLVFLGPTDLSRGQGGWNEVYFGNHADYASAAAALDNIAVKRLAMLSPDCTFIYGEVSDTAVLRDSYAIATPGGPGTFTLTPASVTYNQDLALRTNWFAGSLHRSKRFVRCVPENAVTADGHYDSSYAAWLTAITDWYAAVLANSQLASKIASPPSGGPYYTLHAYDAHTHGNMEGRKMGRPFSLRVGRRAIA